ncbi:DUF1707 SHOCT-like domain-containing protein [Nocardia stercoris]|uniref:DUF1707 domain-containing protein n=1 Tax=Nocardia stercoris TaxID=2483361 RepID=A0A3M2LGT9_9NOCA|nr:DUF1707 domain-containing protein [Nocardia stercoris]RMI33968.1 DUF1707 domain-containing protein [Nocardia stercoris]
MADRDLRVSDAEREHVGELLQKAVGLGMLSLGEFTERMDTALAAKTRGELNAVLVDLPGIRLTGQQAPQPQYPPTGPQYPWPGPWHHGNPWQGGRGRIRHPRPAWGRPRPMPVAGGNVIRSRMSSVIRKGAWQVPPTLYLNNRMSSITLDFTEAVMATQVVELQIDDVCSSMTIVLPPEATVDANEVEMIGSTINSKVRTAPLGPLHLVLRGQIRFGSVTVKYSLGDRWRRLMNGF